MRGDIWIRLPLRLVSEANAHTHWRTRARRAKEHRSLTAGLLSARLRCEPASPLVLWPAIVCEITRVAPRRLDSDNLVGAAKHVRDGVADALGITDRDERVTWTVSQSSQGAGAYMVEIMLRPAALPP